MRLNTEALLQFGVSQAFYHHHLAARSMASNDAQAGLGDSQFFGQELQHCGIGAAVFGRSGYADMQRSVVVADHPIAGGAGLNADVDGEGGSAFD